MNKKNTFTKSKYLSEVILDKALKEKLEKRWWPLVGVQKYISESGTAYIPKIEDDWNRMNFMKFCENTLFQMAKRGQIGAHYFLEKNKNKDILGLLKEELMLKEDPNWALTGGFQKDATTGRNLGIRIPHFTSDDTVIPKVMFPILRRVFPDLIANKLISTQVLDQPQGYIFYFDWYYDQARGKYPESTVMTNYPLASMYDKTVKKTYYRNANNPGQNYLNERDTTTYRDEQGNIVEGFQQYYANQKISFRVAPTDAMIADNTNDRVFSNRVVATSADTAQVVVPKGVYKIVVDFLKGDTDIDASMMVKMVEIYVDNIFLGYVKTSPISSLGLGATANLAAAQDLLINGSISQFGLRTNALVGIDANRNVVVYVDFGNLADTNATTNRPGTIVYSDQRFEDASTIGVASRLLKGISNTECIYNDELAGEVAYIGGKNGDQLSFFDIFVVQNQESTPYMAEMNFALRNVLINVGSRKLKASWTIEGEQDWKAFHGIDIQAEMVKAISQQFNMEIDRDTITQIRGIVIPQLRTMYNFDDGEWSGVGNYHALDTSTNYGDRYIALAEKVVKSANNMTRFNLKGAANWIVTSHEIATGLSLAQGWSEIPNVMNNGKNITEVGSWRNGMTVYIDPFIEKNTIIFGRKGENPYDSGIVYTPYATYTSQTIEDPYVFDRVRMFMIRDGFTKIPRGEFNYGLLTLTGSLIENY